MLGVLVFGREGGYIIACLLVTARRAHESTNSSLSFPSFLFSGDPLEFVSYLTYPFLVTAMDVQETQILLFWRFQGLGLDKPARLSTNTETAMLSNLSEELVGELVSQLSFCPTLSLITARQAHEWTIWCDTRPPGKELCERLMTQPSEAMNDTPCDHIEP